MLESRYIFIMGPPRSGTTALTRMLMNSPEVLLADADAMGTSVGKPTYESGIFTRPLSDTEVMERFQRLDGKAPFILEKTPTHIEHMDRIRNLFKNARFLITHREPFSCMLSWKVATRTFIQDSGTWGAACHRWKTATEVLIKNHNNPSVMPIDFHDFMSGTEQVGSEIFTWLGLNENNLQPCLEKMKDETRVRVPGVVGESVTGQKTQLNWKEKASVSLICRRTEARWQATFRPR